MTRSLDWLPSGSYKLLKWKEKGKVGFFWENGTFKTFMVRGNFPSLLGSGLNLRVIVTPTTDLRLKTTRYYYMTSDRVS